jgi:IK cytokine
VFSNSSSLGLDFALLEQQKAKLYESQDADDEIALEQVFQELSAPKKNTREELVASLKKARSEGVVPIDKPLEIAKQQGKFKPIGAPADTKPKKRKAKGDEKDGEKKKKKKQKLEGAAEVQEGGSNPQAKEETLPSSSKPQARPRTPSPEIDPDANIFGDAEEYRGLPSESEEEEGQEPRVKAQASTSTRVPPPPADSIPRKDWFGEKPELEVPTSAISKRHTKRPTTPEDQHMASGPEAGQEEEEQPRHVARLQALASSSVPSVRDILAMDEAAEREEKRKEKKEKRNKKKNPTEETKINREVKQCVSPSPSPSPSFSRSILTFVADSSNTSLQNRNNILSYWHTFFP